MELRPYQIDVIKKINHAWESYKSIMLQMPTGTGKTNVFCEIIRNQRLKHPGSKILILTHKRELVYQTVKRLRKFSIVPGVIMAGQESSVSHQVQIATVQTLIRRKGRLASLKNVSIIVIDEAHHTPSNTYIDLLNYYTSPETKILGVTATPRRSDGKGFSDIFGTLVQSLSIKEFIELGYLADILHHKTATYYDLKDKLKQVAIDKTTNDFDESELGTLMATNNYMSDAVESYLKYRGNYRKSIVFAVNIHHSKLITARFNARGIKAAHVDATTSPIIRKAILDDFANGLIKVLCNVGIVTEGFDCPDAEIVQLVRPTKSITLYLQQVGRVLRPKTNGGHAIILDSACCYDEFGSVKADRKWSLESYEIDYPEKVAEEDSDSISEVPNEQGDVMVLVDSPSNFAECRLDTSWLEKLIPEIREYFNNRLSHLELNPEELLHAIWKVNDINLSGTSVQSIKDLDQLVNITNLNISHTNCESLRPIMSLKNLSTLNVSYCKANILRLPSDNFHKLKKLNLSGTQISDINLLGRYLNISELLVDNTSIGNFTSLAKLSKLIRFSGNNSQFNSLRDLWGSKETIEILELYNSNLTSLSLIHHLRNIKYLDVSFTCITSLEMIVHCMTLETLVIKGVTIADNTLEEVHKKRPDIWIEM